MAAVLSGYRPLEPTKNAAVAADGLARVARYIEIFTDNGQETTGAEVQHVLYLTGDIVQSMSTAAWLATRGPLPLDPTPQQSSAAIGARDATDAAQAARRAARQARVRSGLAVGVDAGALTNPQLLILVKAMADRLGAFDDDGLLLPVEQWRG